MNRYVFSVAAGLTAPVAISGNVWLCTALTGDAQIAFDQENPADITAGLIRAAPFMRFSLINNSLVAAVTITCYVSIEPVTLAPVGVNQIVTG